MSSIGGSRYSSDSATEGRNENPHSRTAEPSMTSASTGNFSKWFGRSSSLRAEKRKPRSTSLMRMHHHATFAHLIHDAILRLDCKPQRDSHGYSNRALVRNIERHYKMKLGKKFRYGLQKILVQLASEGNLIRNGTKLTGIRYKQTEAFERHFERLKVIDGGANRRFAVRIKSSRSRSRSTSRSRSRSRHKRPRRRRRQKTGLTTWLWPSLKSSTSGKRRSVKGARKRRRAKPRQRPLRPRRRSSTAGGTRTGRSRTRSVSRERSRSVSSESSRSPRRNSGSRTGRSRSCHKSPRGHAHSRAHSLGPACGCDDPRVTHHGRPSTSRSSSIKQPTTIRRCSIPPQLYEFESTSAAKPMRALPADSDQGDDEDDSDPHPQRHPTFIRRTSTSNNSQQLGRNYRLHTILKTGSMGADDTGQKCFTAPSTESQKSLFQRLGDSIRSTFGTTQTEPKGSATATTPAILRDPPLKKRRTSPKSSRRIKALGSTAANPGGILAAPKLVNLLRQ